MHYLSLTLPSLAANVALDEALLEAAEAGELPGPVLRVWESDHVGIVMGRGSRADAEVRWSRRSGERCPVVRRASGGGTVVAGPGCLMYALVLPLEEVLAPQKDRDRIGPSPDPRLDVPQIHSLVLERMATALAADRVDVRRAGVSDLAVHGGGDGPPRKASGNSLRIKRRWILYHGTLLYAFDLSVAGSLLGPAPRPPAYRHGRSHDAFLANLPLSRGELEASLRAAWKAWEPLDTWPRQRTEAVENNMHRTALREMLRRYADRHPGEASIVDRISALIDGHEDCYLRSCRPGHITGSAWVVSEDRSRFLLVHHRKLDRWLQPGGHADGDPDVAGVALREAREESGLERLRIAYAEWDNGPPIPFDLDVHVIPARYDRSGQLVDDAHEHHDVRFLIEGSADERPQASAESHAVRWFTAAEVAQMAPEASILRMLDKSWQFFRR